MNLRNKIKNTCYDLCIYHKSCNDGMAAFWCVKKWGQNLDIVGIPFFHNDPIDKDIFSDKQVLLLDICLSFDRMKKLLNICKNVTVIDHHKSSQYIKNNLLEKNKLTFDLIYEEDKSACQIAWKIMNPEDKEPEFITYIGRRDIGLDWGGKSHLFILGWREKFTHLTFDSVNILYGIKNVKFLNAIIKHGKYKWRENMKKYKELSKNMSIIKFNHNKLFSVGICYANKIDKGDFGIYLCYMYSNIDFVVIYSGKDNNQKASLRTIKNIDLLPIAEKYGGGGHNKACAIVNNNIEKIFCIPNKNNNIFSYSIGGIILGIIMGNVLWKTKR